MKKIHYLTINKFLNNKNIKDICNNFLCIKFENDSYPLDIVNRVNNKLLMFYYSYGKTFYAVSYSEGIYEINKSQFEKFEKYLLKL